MKPDQCSSATIVNCSLGKGTQIYKDVYLKNTRTEKNVSIGDASRVENCIFGESVKVQRHNLIYDSKFGRYTYTGRNLTCWHSQIGAFCSISWNCSIGGANHDYNRLTTSAFLYSDIFDIAEGRKGYDRFDNNCEIGNDVWLGCGCVICRDVKVGDGAVIGANAVVTKDVEPYSIVVGSPAKHIKYRFPKKIIEQLLILKWWDLPVSIIKKYFDIFNSVPSQEIIEKLIYLKSNAK